MLETLAAKDRFKAMALNYGVIPQTYLSDNGVAFTSHEFSAKMKQFEQVSKLFEPLSSYDDDNLEPHIIINTDAPSTPQDNTVHWDSPVQRESPIQREQSPVRPAQIETVSEPAVARNETISNVPVPTPPAAPSPQLRRSTRKRRAPDRLNLYTESCSCFFIERHVSYHYRGVMAKDQVGDNVKAFVALIYRS